MFARRRKIINNKEGDTERGRGGVRAFGNVLLLDWASGELNMKHGKGIRDSVLCAMNR